MSVSPSPIGGFAGQFFDNNGTPLAGGKLFTYGAGTTTPQTTYTSASGAVPHTNPIVLDSAGRVPGGEIWLTNALAYKFVIETATAILIGTYDNVVTPTAGEITFTQAGVGAVPRTIQNKLRDTISVKDFGAVGNGVTDDTVAVQNAINAAVNNVLSLSGGTYVVSNLNIPSYTVLTGPGTIKRKAGATGIMVQGTNADDVQLFDVIFDGNNTGSVSQLVRFDGSSDRLLVKGCSFVNSVDSGLAVSGTSGLATVLNCAALNNDNYGIVIDASGSSHIISGNRCVGNGASGILVSSNYTLVTNNVANDNVTLVNNQAGILLLNSDYCTVSSNQTVNNGVPPLFSHGIQLNSCEDCVMQDNISLGNNGSGLDAFQSPRTVIDGNQTQLNNLRGIEIDTSSDYSVCTSNVVRLNKEVGISVFNTVGVSVANNTVQANGTLGTAINPLLGVANSPYGVALWGAGNYGNFARVTGNVITENVGSGANGVGLYIDPLCIDVILKDNTITANTVAATLVNANLAFAGSNFGLVFELNGTATIPSGSVTVAVIFANAPSFTPSVTDVTLTLLNNPTNAIGEVFASAMTSTGFSIDCRNNPGASGLVIAWNVRKEAF